MTEAPLASMPDRPGAMPDRPGAMPVRLGLVAAVGAVMALGATYWDDAWHTDKGRDEFAIAPHLLLYGGVLITSLSVLAWAVTRWRSAGLRNVRALAADPALLIAGIGGLVTLASAPLDNAWHELYGRDAVLWSPPHLLAVAGTLCLSVGVLAGLRSTTGQGADAARLFAACGVIGALQIPVLEYDSDVPQFSVLWYLPVASLGLCLALALIDDLWPGRWRPLQAAALYTALRAIVATGLPSAGFSGSFVPPILLAVGVAASVGHRPLRLRLAVAACLTPLIWWPALQAQADVAALVPLDQLPLAVALSLAAATLVGWIHGDWSFAPQVRSIGFKSLLVAFMAMVAMGAAADQATAHDPGQGTERSIANMNVTRSTAVASISLTVPEPCDGLTPTRSVARRSGVVLTGPLRSSPSPDRSCQFVGKISGMSAGRWFVYVEFVDTSGQKLEAWVPVKEHQTTSQRRSLYVPPAATSGSGQLLAGAVVLLLVAGLVVACVRLAKATSTTTARSPVVGSGVARS
ncbi:hypothetical protein KSP35_20220 [Aquihabitans sp. G128]|uniref:hypothetical protein n=1 Tax=Aquihabitans sp. G128 TaxID=2849779 RepID=UPI001C21EE37|nr:hypothetical protein [Aquihabitans sp. G128]QXC60621.1 hypothetical protein KSP35_20220 [Aquihabitans sp. G128]